MSVEHEVKLARVRAFCAERGYAGALLRRRASFAWLTCGGNATVERCVEGGVAELLVTGDGVRLVASEIERHRIAEEELGRLPGVEVVPYPWGEAAREETLEALRAGRRMAADCAAPGFEDRTANLAALRFALTPEEERRVHAAALEAASGLEALCRVLEPGVSEREVAARLVAGVVHTGGGRPDDPLSDILVR